MNLDKRQKIILIVLIALVIFLIWQIWGLHSRPTTLAPIKKTTIKTTTTTLTPENTLKPPLPTSIAIPEQPEANFTQPQLIPPQQAEYLRTVDEYQLAQIKRMLAEQIAATAAADANTAKSKAETNKLAGSTSPFFAAGYTTAPTSITSTTPATQVESNVATLPPMQQAPGGNYQVVFISNRAGTWSAILAKNGQYTITTPGMTLSDKTQVVSINNSGVTLLQEGTTTVIPFQNNITG